MKDKICYIFGAGDFSNQPSNKFSEEDLIIAADGGYDHCRKIAIKPDIYIGDSDSVSDTALIESAEKFYLPTEKDETDTLAAVKIGADRGYKRFCIYGGMGGRFSHSVANLQVLAFLAEKNMQGFLFSKDCICTVIKDTDIFYDSSCKGYISIFSFSDSAEGVTIKGLKYETDSITLSNTFPLGISNEFTEKKAEISVKKGFLLIICNYLPAETK